MPDATIAKQNRELNKLLKESKSRIAVSEALSPIKGTVKKLPVMESAGGKQMYQAKLFHADKVNQNGRLYKRSTMQSNIDRLTPKMADGYVNGSVDHGTGLATQVVMFREMHIEPDGSGMGSFEIVAGHSEGKNLQAQIDAGMAVGWSTFGYGSAHAPTDQERTDYGLAPDEDCVIMGDDYDLTKIDAVDDPSVHDARIVQQQSRQGDPVKESVTAEACQNGLHWIEIGECGHKLCECKCESDDKHAVYRNKVCDKCAASKSNLSVSEFKQLRLESKNRKPVTEAQTREPLAKSYSQYIQSKSGNSFEPVGPMRLAAELSRDAFRIISTWSGVRFERMAPMTDDLYHFRNSVIEGVISEVDRFFDLSEDYKKLGVRHSRGISMEGAPGCGKTSCLHQISDMVADRGDIVFYSTDANLLIEGLNAFREVEPTRKIVVALEDLDKYAGYQEQAFLNLLDGAQSVNGVCYISTTNYPERIPPRMLRPGRFDKRVTVGPPSIEGRHAYLSNKIANLEPAEEIDRLAKETEGFSFGHLREFVTAAYALKEPKADVLARLKAGSPKNSKKGEGCLNSCSEVAESKSPVKQRTKMPESLVESINKLLQEHKGLEGLNIPEREVLPSEFAEQLEKANGSIADRDAKIVTLTAEHKKQIDTLAAEKAELQKQLDAVKAEKANADRLAKVGEKAAAVLKDNKFATLIQKAITDAAVRPDFTAEHVEALIAAQTSNFEAVAALLSKTPGGNLDGSLNGANIDDQTIDDIEEENEGEDLVQDDVQVTPFAGFGLGKKKTK